MKPVHWRDCIPCFDALTEKIKIGVLITGSDIQTAIQRCTAGHAGSDDLVLGVPSSSIAYLEYLFYQAGGPYSPDFEWIAIIIQIFFRSNPDLQHLINLNAADALANMVLNKRGRLKFLISDQVELWIILEWWERFGLIPVSGRQVLDAILNKPTIKDRIENGDPLLIMRLLDVFPEYADEINPCGYDRETLLSHAGTITKPPSERRYHHVFITAQKAGRDIHSLIQEEERRILPMQTKRNRYLAYLVKNLHGNCCQICSVMGEETTGPVEVHHIIPLSEQGKDLAENMLTLCVPHHQAVHAGTIIVKKEDETVIIQTRDKTWSLPPNNRVNSYV
ncbi:HNH endonuclease signature motif containing protein [Methanospirillum hungatei]|jgi:hypothetical protein|uniref:HNH endonuclease signature motif containing protein n=1 Tax=Methanospirillum hungatei TaxID=2203 RepID=UPI001B71C503|nr:HNH endonuclease signature motif containing protein [Methanospirillum hungatei]MBP9007217.1 HNH endonuclease [Methanospirillum sp.]HOW05687.1 HNH endonuclease signature motif containing protein [Methanospirillum hungatei]